MKRLVSHICFIAIGFSYIPSVFTHDFSRSHSFWQLDQGRVSGVFIVKQREATRIPMGAGRGISLADHFVSYLKDRVFVKTVDGSCAGVIPGRLQGAAPGYFRVAFEYQCPVDNGIVLAIPAFHDFMEGHIHIAHIESADTKDLYQLVFNKSRTERNIVSPTITFGPEEEIVAGPQSDWEIVREFVVLGAGHVLSGMDHLAFLLMLLFIAVKPLKIIAIVTGFTIGHSISLCLAYFHVVSVDQAANEALIGFTVLLVTVEYVARQTGMTASYGIIGSILLMTLGCVCVVTGINAVPALLFVNLALFTLCYFLLLVHLKEFSYFLTALITVLFGFIHGFGFAGNLNEMKINDSSALFPLLGFNVGVELGQLSFILLVGATAYMLTRLRLQTVRLSLPFLIVPLLSGLGTYWFIQRSLI